MKTTPNLNSNLADMFIPPIDPATAAPLKAQTDSPTIMQWYDTTISNAQNAVDDTLDQQAINQEKFKKDIKNKYSNFKNAISSAYDTIKKDIQTGTTITKIAIPLLGGVLVWKLIGKDIYTITRKK